MDRLRITKMLIFLLCVLSAVIATGLIIGLSMWPWIVAYWVTLTMKNLLTGGANTNSVTMTRGDNYVPHDDHIHQG